MGAEIIAALIGAAATLVIGVPTVYYMRRALKLQAKDLLSKLDRAEGARDQAESSAERFRQRLENAPGYFARALGELIEDASRESRDAREAALVSAARAIVSSRNGFVSVLGDVSKSLNSDIDNLAREVDRRPPSLAEIASIVDTLRRKWPAKEQEIALAVRKLITELGLYPEEYGSPRSSARRRPETDGGRRG